MRIGARCAALVFLAALPAQASTFPVQDAQAAIAIAKDVCRDKADASADWQADFDAKRQTWFANTMHGVKQSGDIAFVVGIPVNGPYPTNCAVVDFEIVRPRDR